MLSPAVGRKTKATKENPRESGDKRREKIFLPFVFLGFLMGLQN
jgi:hypothetical protein